MCKLIFLSLLMVGAAMAIYPLPPHASLPSQAGLAKLFFSAKTTQHDLKTSVACFSSYIAELSLLGEYYGQNYTACYDRSKKDRNIATWNMKPERLNLELASNEICNKMQRCNNMNSTLDMFNCHEAIGTNNAKQTYIISGNASEYAVLLQERLRLIDIEYERCVRQTDRVYVDSSADNYKYLHLCLDGKVKPKPMPPKPTTTTTTTTTTTSTTTTTPAPPTTPPYFMSTEDPKAIQDQFAQLMTMLQ